MLRAGGGGGGRYDTFAPGGVATGGDINITGNPASGGGGGQGAGFSIVTRMVGGFGSGNNYPTGSSGAGTAPGGGSGNANTGATSGPGGGGRVFIVLVRE